MKILVCVKQVPAKTVPMDKTTGVLDRTQAGGRINPWDLYAIEIGLRLREALGGTLTAFSMGPEKAIDTLKTALSMGADKAALLSDRAFAGADVYATAFAISQGIKALEKEDGEYDVILCGQQTTDGDTAQLPFSLAYQLKRPGIGWVKKLDSQTENSVTVIQELSYGVQRATVGLPCVMSIGDGIGTPRIPSLRDQLRAKSKTVSKLTLEDLEEKNPLEYGLKASPTQVVKIHEVSQGMKCAPINLSPSDSARLLLDKINLAKGGKAE